MTARVRPSWTRSALFHTPNDELYDAFVKGAILRDVGDGRRYYGSLAIGCYIDNGNVVRLFSSTHGGAEIVVPKPSK